MALLSDRPPGDFAKGTIGTSAALGYGFLISFPP